MSEISADKEATLREVLAEISLLDFGKILIASLKLLAVWTVIFFVFGLFGSGYSEIGGPTFPPALSNAVLVFFGVLLFSFRDRSYHEIGFKFYFPKMSWLGVFLLTAYIWGLWEIQRTIYVPDPAFARSMLNMIVFWLVYFPGMIFLVVITVGHSKLMDRREGRSPRDVSEFV